MPKNHHILWILAALIVIILSATAYNFRSASVVEPIDSSMIDLNTLTTSEDAVVPPRNDTASGVTSLISLDTIEPQQVTGYVIQNYTCPPCPEGSACKPCMRQGIVIASEARIKAVPFEENDLIIYTEKPEVFKTGSRYQFTVKVVKDNTASQSVQASELIDYKQVD